MTSGERSDWLALADEFSALRRANEASRMDIAVSGYDPEKVSNNISDVSNLLLNCEKQIRSVAQESLQLLWRWRRAGLGRIAYQAFHTFDRRTDDSFDWTSQASEIRRARDSIYQKLIALGVI